MELIKTLEPNKAIVLRTFGDEYLLSFDADSNFSELDKLFVLQNVHNIFEGLDKDKKISLVKRCSFLT